jgi:hypothetical protein
MSKLLSRDDLLGGSHLKRERLDVPELGGYIFIRELTAEQTIAFNSQITEWRKDGSKEITAEMSFILMNMVAVFSICDEDGKQIFQADDHPAIPIETLSTIAKKALSLSGMRDDVADGLSSEVAANLKNDLTTSLPSG